jgi:pyruvate dehydrogenase E1 component alpha subunit
MLKDEFLKGTDGLYGAFHIYIGEEAVATGAIGALNNDDFIASTHRGHGHLIAKGGDINKMSAEIYFKQSGYNQAHGGSMHITDVSRGILGMNGIIGPSYLLSAGAAYGIKVRGTQQVAMAFGGDGSVQNGWFWAAMRNAALYKLPLIGVIENNGWQISMPTNRTIGVTDLNSVVDGLGIPNETVDGTDVIKVYSVAQQAVARARAGEGPSVIEAKTYRFYDHAGLAGAEVGRLGAFGLPYRSDREVLASIANDPIPKLRRLLVMAGILTDERATQIEEDVKGQVTQSIELARAAPLPPQDGALNHVYAGLKVAASQFVA